MNLQPYAYLSLAYIGAFNEFTGSAPSSVISQYFSSTDYKLWRASEIVNAVALIKGGKFAYGYLPAPISESAVNTVDHYNLNSAIFCNGLEQLYNIKTGGIRHAYDSAMLYEKNARVIYNDIEYISQIDNNINNIANDDNWKTVKTEYRANKIILSNNIANPNTQIDFSAGNFEFSDKSDWANFSAITGDLSLVFGNGIGMLDVGAKANSTWYYCYAIYNPTTGISKPIASINSTIPTLPSGYTKYRKIGCIMTDGLGNIRQFYTTGNRTLFKTMLVDRTVTSAPTSRTLLTLTAPANVPAIIICQVYHGTVNPGLFYALITETSYTDAIPSSSNFTARITTPGGGQQDNTMEIIRTTDASSQIALRSSDANLYLGINTIGFINDVF